MTDNENKQSNSKTFIKKIDTMTYEVIVNFSKTNKENMSDKISRLIKNDISKGEN